MTRFYSGGHNIQATCLEDVTDECEFDRDYLDKVDQLDCRKITIH